MSDLPVHYRYIDATRNSGTVEITECKFYPIRETAHFYWLLDASDYEMYNAGVNWHWDKRAIRVGKRSMKPKYSPCKKIALNSFKARKRWQCYHAKRALTRSIHLLKKLNDIELLETVNFYGTEYANMGIADKVIDFDPFNEGIRFEDFIE